MNQSRRKIWSMMTSVKLVIIMTCSAKHTNLHYHQHPGQGQPSERKADLESFFTIQHEYLDFFRTGFCTVLKLLALK